MERSTTGSILRSTQAWCDQICEKQTLNHGIAYYSPRFAGLPEANQFREVVIDSPAAVPEAAAEADAWFQARSLTCHRWAPAGGPATAELAAFLEKNRFQKREHTVMLLTDWPERRPASDVRVVHGRAMREALRATFTKDAPSGASARHELAADACEERLNDPPYDMFVATVDGEPAGRCALYQVGDIARVMDLSVRERFADRGVDAVLVLHVLALAKRLAMRNICTQVEDGCQRHPDWFAQFGFVPDGTLEEFDRIPADPSESRL